MDDSFTLSLVHVQGPPQGGGKHKRYVPGKMSCSKLKARKTHSCIPIPREDNNLCCAKALVVAPAIATLSPEATRRYRRRDRINSRKFLDEVHRPQLRAKIPRNQRCGPPELEKLAGVLPNFKIVVVDANRRYERYVYGSGNTLLGLLYSDGHYDTITSLAGFFDKSYFCGRCISPYNWEGHHACANNPDHCPRCLQTGCPDFLDARQSYRSPDVFCPHCRISFFGSTCQLKYITHTRAEKPATNPSTTVCSTVQRCATCFKLLNFQTRDRAGHRCGYAECPSCRDVHDLNTHRCYVQTHAQILAKKQRDRHQRRQRVPAAAEDEKDNNKHPH